MTSLPSLPSHWKGCETILVHRVIRNADPIEQRFPHLPAAVHPRKGIQFSQDSTESLLAC
eukprot:4423311-Amphidinium_carterae.1